MMGWCYRPPRYVRVVFIGAAFCRRVCGPSRCRLMASVTFASPFVDTARVFSNAPFRLLNSCEVVPTGGAITVLAPISSASPSLIPARSGHTS
jgi:hypothetical protein